MKEFYTKITFLLIIWITKIKITECFLAEILCDLIPDFTPGQRKICATMPNATIALSMGHHFGSEECKYQFAGYRWNCSHLWKQDYFNHFSDIGTREVAYAYAVTSAGAVHSIAFACARGNITRCGCKHRDRSPNYLQHVYGGISNPNFEQDHTHRRGNELAPHKKRHQKRKASRYEQDPKKILDSDQAWKWGGCSLDIDFAMKFAKQFYDARELENDARTLMNKHNNMVGRKIVKHHMKTECQCLGTSGSCSIKTCWQTLPDFRTISNALMKKYAKARMVKSVQDPETKKYKLVIHKNEMYNVGMPPKRMDLVFLHSSPNYCDKNILKNSLGTKDRQCNPKLKDLGSCNLLCCGRGYSTTHYYSHTKCNCKFVWCCSVKCDTCTEYHEDHYCK